MRRQGLLRRRDRDGRSKLDRIAVRSCRDRRKGDRAAAMLVRELDRAAVARREQLVFPGGAAAPDRADGGEDVTGREVSPRRRFRVAGLAAAKLPALLEDGRSAGAVDRPVDTAP